MAGIEHEGEVEWGLTEAVDRGWWTTPGRDGGREITDTNLTSHDHDDSRVCVACCVAMRAALA